LRAVTFVVTVVNIDDDDDERAGIAGSCMLVSGTNYPNLRLSGYVVPASHFDSSVTISFHLTLNSTIPPLDCESPNLHRRKTGQK
jgi:hypothetical protein